MDIQKQDIPEKQLDLNSYSEYSTALVVVLLFYL